MYRSSETGRFELVNPALVRLLGYASADEVLALDLGRDVYVDPKERTRIIEAHRASGVFEGAVRGGADEGARATWKRCDGTHVIVRIFAHVVDGEHGASFDASVLDVTGLERQRDQLERTARTLEIVVEQMPAFYWLVDRSLVISEGGGATESLLGIPLGSWRGRSLHTIDNTESGTESIIDMHTRVLAGERVSSVRTFRDKQLRITIAPHTRDGEIVGAIGTGIDVTAMHALEQRMVDAQRAESLGVLASGLAHDFNNLLVAILGNADLGLRDTPPGAPGHAALDNVRHASLRAAELTGQLLAYAGKGGVSTTRVPMRPLVDELLRITAPTLPARVEIDVDIADDLAMRGEAAQIRQVFLNLIANARDALTGRGGTIRISARVHAHDGYVDANDVVTPGAHGTYLLFEVADDGPGIDRDTRRRIFEPFFTTKPTGHGLGLAAVLGIIRAHGGGLRLVTAPREGARFQVMWPAATPPVTQTVAAPPANAPTVLVIDDEDLVRDVVARMIEDLGYAALTAVDGVAGLEVVAAHDVDAVLVDLTMPRMNGADVVAALRARKPDLPIILCTGYDRDGRGPVEATPYLPKPFRIEALEATLAMLFRDR